MYEAKLEFPGGREGAKQTTFRGRSMDILWNCTLCRNDVLIHVILGCIVCKIPGVGGGGVLDP